MNAMVTREHVGLEQVLSRTQTASVNRCLRYHGLPEIEPCKVGDLFESLRGLELGRWVHIVGELTDTLDGQEKGGQL